MKPALALLPIALVALLAACASRDTARDETVAPPAPRVVALSTTEYAFQAPDSIPAGWTTLRLANLGGEIHYGHIVRIDSGRTIEQLVAAYEEAIRTSGPRPKWVTRFGGPGGTPPGGTSSVIQRLEPGEYVWICPIEDESGKPHFGKGEVKPFVVYAAGPESPVAGSAGAEASGAPASDMTVRLTDYGFELGTPVAAGSHMVKVENAGVEPHDLVLMKLAEGRTSEDVRMFLDPERARRDQPAEPPPPFESLGTGAGGIAAIAPGMASWFEAEFTPGEYVLVCMATAPDGRSHIEHGMIRQVTVR
jgi:hypothetical protein